MGDAGATQPAHELVMAGDQAVGESRWAAAADSYVEAAAMGSLTAMLSLGYLSMGSGNSRAARAWFDRALSGGGTTVVAAVEDATRRHA